MSGRVLGLCFVLAFGAAGACTTFGGSEPTDAQPDAAAGTPDGSVDGGVPADEDIDDAGLIEPEDDGGGLVDAALPADAAPCVPTRAFVPDTPAGGPVCNVEGVLPGAMEPTGLDYTDVAQYGVIDGKTATACVAAELPSPVVQIRVEAAVVASACGGACGGGYCGVDQGRRARVFLGSAGAYTFVGVLGLGLSPATYVVPVPAGISGREVLVCRTGANIQADDVAVHAITGVCSL